MTKSAENDPEVKKLLKVLEKSIGHKFPIPPLWGAKRAKKEMRKLIKIFDPKKCPVCGGKR